MNAITVRGYGGVDVLKKATTPKPRELLVKIKGVSVNPVDYKVRAGLAPFPTPEIIGWDASGIVEAIGEEVSLFNVGEEVIFAGSVIYQGCYADYTVVDERIVGHKPKTVSFADAAGLPLASLTAWEAIVERLGIPISTETNPHSLLIINGAGDVGSMAIQITRQVLHLTNVIATASRPETIDWCKKLGATHVLNHHEPLGPQLKEFSLGVDYVFIAYEMEALSRICGGFHQTLWENCIGKSISFTWESIFTKSLTGVNMVSQGVILTKIGQLLDDKSFIPVSTVQMSFSLENLRKSHTLLETKSVIGKIVFEVADD